MAESSKKYRAAIIGIGAIAHMHARAMGDLPNVELVAGSCRTPEKGNIFAEKFRCKWYGDYNEMLEKEKPDLVTICLPSGAHMMPTMEALARNIHVLCEKPLEVSTARIDQMIQAASTSKARLGGIFPQRFNPVVQLLHQAASKGRFGNLAAINSYVPWWRDDRYYAPHRWQGTLELDGGGAMMNQSIHGVDLVQWIAGAAMAHDLAEDYDPKVNPVEEVFAYTAKRGHDPDLIEVEDTCVACLRFRNGALGQLLGATSMYPGTLKRLQVAGRDGTAEVQEDELTKYAFRTEDPYDDQTRRTYAAKTATGGGASDPMAIDYSNHTRNIGAFLKSIDEGTHFELDAAESRKAVAIIEAMYESAKTGKPVAVK